jgi:hypothetical protein
MLFRPCKPAYAKVLEFRKDRQRPKSGALGNSAKASQSSAVSAPQVAILQPVRPVARDEAQGVDVRVAALDRALEDGHIVATRQNMNSEELHLDGNAAGHSIRYIDYTSSVRQSQVGRSFFMSALSRKGVSHAAQQLGSLAAFVRPARFAYTDGSPNR